MQRNFKVCHIITGLNKGGAEVFLLQLCIELNKLEPNICSVISLSKKKNLIGQFNQNNIEVLALNMQKNPFSLFINLIRSIRYCKKNNVKVIHAHMVHSLLFASMIKLYFPSIQIIFTAHSVRLSSKMMELLARYLKGIRAFDIVFSKSSSQKFNCSRISVIPNGINIQPFLSSNLSKNKTFTFIAVGRLEKMKNHLWLIENFNRLKTKENVQLQIIGEGIVREKLEQTILNQNLQNRIFILGKKDNVYEYLNRAHCFLLPSEWEGFPISLLEAAAASLPCIVTPQKAIIENFPENLLYYCELDSFIEKMDFVVQNYEEAQLKALNFHKEVKNNFGIVQNANQHLKIYQALEKEISENEC